MAVLKYLLLQWIFCYDSVFYNYGFKKSVPVIFEPPSNYMILYDSMVFNCIKIKVRGK